jgi:rhodanese-related sulfurtransferase
MHGSPLDVEPLMADELVQRGALLLDVREPDEFAAGHALNAVLLPVGDIEGRVGELAVSRDVVCVCRSGVRSAAAAEFLRSRGITARNVLGGMHAWATEGLPVVTSDGRSGTVI